MNAMPITANATPIASNGHVGPPESSGTSRPAPKLTASAVSPVRHHARYVRSFASRVRLVASRASSSSAATTAHSTSGYLFPGNPSGDCRQRSRWFDWSANQLAAAADRSELAINPIIFAEVCAHAAVSRLTLLTRDARRYRTYFPTVELVSPS
jgi:hypothetical protein